MPIFNTIDSLENYIQNVTIPEIVSVVEPEVREVLNEEVYEKVYANSFMATPYDEEFYKHTFGLDRTAMSELMKLGNDRIGRGIYMEIYLKPAKQYYSFYGEENVTDKIVKYLNDGHKGYYKQRAIDYQGRGFFESAFKELLKGGRLKKLVTSSLKSIGYVIGRSSSD